MRTFVLLLTLTLGASWSLSLRAHTFVYNLIDGTPVFSMSFPDGWRLDLDFDPPAEGIGAPPPPRVVEAIPKDGAKLWLGTWVLTEITDIQDALTYFNSLEQFIFSNVVIEDTDETDHNGMRARVLKGTARKEKDPVEWVVAFFQPQPEIVAAVLYVGVAEARQYRQAEMRAIVDSIKAVN